ncbi:hypothetical protein DER71_1141 [Halanaerobium sp. DL-01]|uniref:hypothetical protein n=1 Tax=Halanaerobium sp. DL-01 TaxID=1653064 RepID=UPI000DF12812|nr:hypothetical protein [Halanaerobium sp. DL-01]RCW84197.1 hypothetical protein DER71_1141 [Halanaerobium sp. DL-01]
MKDSKVSKIPYGHVGIIVHKSCKDLGEKIDGHLADRRKWEFNQSNSKYFLEALKDSYVIDSDRSYSLLANLVGLPRENSRRF